MASSEPPGDAAGATPPAPAAQEQSPASSPPTQPPAQPSAQTPAAGEGAGEVAGEAAVSAGEAAGGAGEETGLLPPTHWTELAGQVGVISSVASRFGRAERLWR